MQRMPRQAADRPHRPGSGWTHGRGRFRRWRLVWRERAFPVARSPAPHAEVVARWLCRARASVILSRREGSCVVVAESLFADTPAALLENAEVGSRAFINASTGRLLRDQQPLGPAIAGPDSIVAALSAPCLGIAAHRLHAEQPKLNEIVKKTLLQPGAGVDPRSGPHALEPRSARLSCTPARTEGTRPPTRLRGLAAVSRLDWTPVMGGFL